MQEEQNLHKTKGSKREYGWLPIIICWLAYIVAYTGRYSYSSNVNLVISDYGVSHAEAGMVTTFFFFAYGAGQVINGLLVRRYNKRVVVSVALLVSCGANLALFFKVPFAAIKYLWLVNGLAQSVFWPSFICILSEVLSDKFLSKATVIMGSTMAAGTLVIYGVSALLAKLNAYVYVYLIGASLLAAFAVVWFAVYKKTFISAPKPDEEKGELTPVQDAKKPKITHGTVLLIIVFCVLAAACNLVKDGLTVWVPAVLKESFELSDSLSIALSLLLPVVGLFGIICITWLNKGVKSFMASTGIFYALTTVCAGGTIGLLSTKLVAVIIIVFSLISLLTHGINGLLTSLVPMTMRGSVNSGKLAGILNGCCYVGSTISSYGLGAMADKCGWEGVFYLLLAVCGAMTILSFVLVITEKARKKKNNLAGD